MWGKPVIFDKINSSTSISILTSSVEIFVSC